MIKPLFIALGVLLIALQSVAQSSYKVGVSLDDTLAKRWLIEKNLLESKIKEYNGETITKISGGDAKVQVQQVYDLINKDKITTLIVVANDAESMAKVINYAHSKGVEIIAYDRMIPNAHIDAYVSFDNIEVGRIMAKKMLQVSPKGNYMIISGPVKDKNSLSLKKGQMEVLTPEVKKGNINIIYNEHAEEWLDAAAFKAVFDFTSTNPEVTIDVVLAANDNMASGAIEALELSGMENVLVAGQDAEKDAIKRIKGNQQVMTVRKPIEQLALLAAILATHSSEKEIEKLDITISKINNGKNEIKAYLLNPELVDINTLEGN